MRLVDATPLECQAKECKENEWNQRVSPTSWAHAEESLLHRIEDAPTVDAVIVTRCKDCQSYNKPKTGWCEVHLDSEHPDDYCSYGKRKDGNDG